MVVSGSNSLEWNNCVEIEGEETLGKMGKEENKVEDVEEGEISDTASVEEISEEDFIKQETSSKVSPKPKSESRVWTMQDLYNYQVSRGYASSLYNLAWAQAVQNKPLNDIFVMDVEKDEKLKRSSSTASTAASAAATTTPPAVASVVVVEEKVKNEKVVDEVVIDDSGDDMDVEKEDGELEEGEIDLDSETVEKEEEEVEMTVEMAVEKAAEAKPEVEEVKLKVIAKEEEEEGEGISSIESVNVERLEIDSKEKELEKRVDSIREALGSVNVIEAEK